MYDWNTLETVLFFAVALPVSIVSIGIFVLKIKKSSTADKIICGGAIATIFSTFLPWYNVEFVQLTLWDTNRFMAFLILAAGVEALAQTCMRMILFGRSKEMEGRGAQLEVVALITVSALALLLTIIRWASIPEMKVEFEMAFIFERSWGPWIGVLASAVFASGSVMKLMEER